MATLDEFLHANSELSVSEAQPTAVDDKLLIHAVVTGVSPNRVQFSYRGMPYSILRKDIVDISDNSSPDAASPVQGKAVLLQVAPGARVTSQSDLPASSLSLGLPFAFRRPSPPVPFTPSPADKAWRANVGYPMAASGDPQLSVTVSFTGWHVDEGGTVDPDIGFRGPRVYETDTTCFWQGPNGYGQIYDDNNADH